MSQRLPDWIDAHRHAFAFFGGVAEITVPDNLKSAVTKACRYEPDLNPTYRDMARHYGTVIIPARAGNPRDKAKVEEAVQMVERWIVAPLRHRRFFSLHELNAAIAEKLAELNERPFQKLEGSRRSLFEDLDRPALKPLPQTPYEYAEWKKARVNIDYHVEFEHHYYSVPYQLVKEPVELRITANTVEILFKGRRVASHPRNAKRGAHTTEPSHMPQGPSAISRVDSFTDHDLGRPDRADDRGARHGHPGIPQAPRAGLPQLPGHPAAGKTLLARAARGGLRPCPCLPRPELSQCREHPEDRAGPPGACP